MTRRIEKTFPASRGPLRGLKYIFIGPNEAAARVIIAVGLLHCHYQGGPCFITGRSELLHQLFPFCNQELLYQS